MSYRWQNNGLSLRNWRVAKSFTYQQAADHINVSVEDYKRYEDMGYSIRTIPLNTLPIYPV